MNEVKRSILEAGRKQLLEMADYEMEKVLANINDKATDPKKKRKITVNLTFMPDQERKIIVMQSQVKSTLAPTEPATTTLFNTRDSDQETGEILNVLKEVSGIAPGQLNIDGEVYEQEVVVIGMGAEKLIKSNAVKKIGNAISEEGEY